MPSPPPLVSSKFLPIEKDAYQQALYTNLRLVTNKKYKKPKKIWEFVDIPPWSDHHQLYQLNISQLKQILKHYDMSTSGNKPQLYKRVHSFYYFSFYLTKIQSIYRKHLVKKWKKMHSVDRKLGQAHNTVDFATYEPLSEIPGCQQICFLQEGQQYVCALTSLHQLISFKPSTKSSAIPPLLNPYTRIPISSELQERCKNMMHLSKIIGIQVKEEPPIIVSEKKSFEFRVLEFVQVLNGLGYYVHPEWFHEMDGLSWQDFLFEFEDIWKKRVDLTLEFKKAICPPHGRLSFRFLRKIDNIGDKEYQQIAFNLLEKLVYCCEDSQNKILMINLFLMAFVNVSPRFSEAFPWLYL